MQRYSNIPISWIVLPVWFFQTVSAQYRFIDFAAISPNCAIHYNDLYIGMDEAYSAIRSAWSDDTKTGVLSDGTANNGRANRLIRTFFSNDYVTGPYGANANTRDPAIATIRCEYFPSLSVAADIPLKRVLAAQYTAMAGAFDPTTKQDIILMCGNTDIAWVTTWQRNYGTAFPQGGAITTNVDF